MIFLDNASTTKMHKFIVDKINDINEEYCYNPSALYSKGLDANKKIAEYKTRLKDCLYADSFDNIIFTGSATESNNMALRAISKKNGSKILISSGEHPSIYNVAIDMQNQGYNVEFIKLTDSGTIDYDDFVSKMDKDTIFVSVIHVSNETGAINDIKKLVSYAKSVNPKVVFHSDGVQAFGKIKVNVSSLGVDMYTISAHKICGMKGVGALYIKNGINIKPFILGGGQENGLRSGTENLIGIMTLVEAGEYAKANQKLNYEKVSELKSIFIDTLKNELTDYVLISRENNSPYIISISFPLVRAETLLHKLDKNGVLIGNGSACSSKKSGNRVLSNMGISKDIIEGSIRISFSAVNTVDEVIYAAKIVAKCTKEYKEMVR